MLAVDLALACFKGFEIRGYVVAVEDGIPGVLMPSPNISSASSAPASPVRHSGTQKSAAVFPRDPGPHTRFPSMCFLITISGQLYTSVP